MLICLVSSRVRRIDAPGRLTRAGMLMWESVSNSVLVLGLVEDST